MTNKPRILVIGDAMLDTYIYGDVGRVSPEAPVPVVCPTREEDRPGGAANVACNAASLGAKVMVLIPLGSDEQAKRLVSKLQEYGVNVSGILRGVGQHTINKIRLVGNGQQIVRVDMNDSYSLGEAAENLLLARFREALPAQDAVILSDYGKGVCTERLCREVISMCGDADKPVIVDPKGTNWEKYRGAFVITPNMKEINLFAGKSVPNDNLSIEAAYQNMCCRLGIRYLLLTRSEQGMSLLDDRSALHISTQAREVNDVSGAGDTVVAALAVQLGKNAKSIEKAVRFANAAAGVVVEKQGTATVTMDEVLARITDVSEKVGKQKIYTTHNMDDLERKICRWRAAGETIVTTNGCFDILHIGHLKVLNEAKKQGDRLVVAINSDSAVRRLKGSQRPVNSEVDRAMMLISLRMVDEVVIFDPEETPDALTDDERAKLSAKALAAAPEAPMALMRRIRPDVHVKGGDYTAADVPEALFANRLVLVPFEDGYSTTATLERMKGESK